MAHIVRRRPPPASVRGHAPVATKSIDVRTFVSFNPGRRTIISTAIGSSLAVVAVAGVGIADAHHTVTLQVDGVSEPVSGFSRTVGQVLDAAGVSVSEHDMVAPALGEPLTEGQQIVVRTAKQYSLAVDGQAKDIWSTGDSVSDVLADGASSGVVTMVADRSEARPELPVTDASGTVTVQADGQSHEVASGAADTATSLLAKAGIEVSPIDRVQWTNGGEGGIALTVTRVGRGQRTQTETLAHGSEQREDASLAKGTTKVLQQGVDGSLETTYYEETVDGEVTVSTKISENRTDPVAEVVAVGTKEPVATPASTSSSSASAGASSSAAAGGAWAALAQCESGGNPRAVNPAGYYGLYQFDLQTWASVGGSGNPIDASAAEQTARAQILYSQRGWAPWGCASIVGLS